MTEVPLEELVAHPSKSFNLYFIINPVNISSDSAQMPGELYASKLDSCLSCTLPWEAVVWDADKALQEEEFQSGTITYGFQGPICSSTDSFGFM